MMTMLVILLCVAIVISAIWADRSARSKHTFRAIGLNLCGIGCLLLGLVAIVGWSASHGVVPRGVTIADADENPASLVGLLAERAERPAETLVAAQPKNDPDSTPGAAVESAEPDTGKPAATSGESAEDTGNPAEAAEQKPGGGRDELPAELPAEQPAESTASQGGPAADGISLQQMAQVYIDYDARPEWVECEESDQGAVHVISVCSGPYLRLREAREQLSEQLKKEVDEYINRLVGNPRAATWIGYDEQEIRAMLVSPDHFFDEKVISPSFGVMHQSHALLEFGPEFQNMTEMRWRDVVTRGHLARLAFVGGAVFATLVLLFGYFQVDTATRGFYTGRLRFATAVAILGLVALGVGLARSVPWIWL